MRINSKHRLWLECWVYILSLKFLQRKTKYTFGQFVGTITCILELYINYCVET